MMDMKRGIRPDKDLQDIKTTGRILPVPVLKKAQRSFPIPGLLFPVHRLGGSTKSRGCPGLHLSKYQLTLPGCNNIHLSKGAPIIPIYNPIALPDEILTSLLLPPFPQFPAIGTQNSVLSFSLIYDSKMKYTSYLILFDPYTFRSLFHIIGKTICRINKFRKIQRILYYTNDIGYSIMTGKQMNFNTFVTFV